MRTWMSLPACRRYSSLASTANTSLCRHCNSYAIVSGHLHDSNASSRRRPHRQSQTGAIRRSSSFGQRLARSQPRRSFSGTTCARITLEEDDDEGVEPLVNNNVVGRVERAGGNVTRDEDLRKLISSRASKPKRRPPPKRLNPGELRKIDHKAQMLHVTPRLFQEFVNLKYAFIEHRVSQCSDFNRRIQYWYDEGVSAIVAALEEMVRQSSKRNQILERKYCAIEFPESPKLSDRLSRTEKRIATLSHEVYNGIIECSHSFTSNLSQMLQVEYLRPRQSARAKIDRLLSHTETIHRHYAELQAKGGAARDGLIEVLALCSHLVEDCRLGDPGFEKIWGDLQMHQAGFGAAAHHHRAGWLKRQYSLHPLMKSVSSQTTIFASSSRLSQKYMPSTFVRVMILDDKTHRAEKRKLEKRQHVVASAIKVEYMKRWNGPKRVDDPCLDTHWRQLDLLAPFDILNALHWLLLSEVWYLVATLQGKFGPMWDRLSPVKVLHYSVSIHQWVVKFREEQKGFIRELFTYKHTNLIRLQVERKLHELAEPNDIRQRGLFVPLDPLSQDHERFQLWVTRMCSISFDAWYMHKASSLGREHDSREKWQDIINRYHELENSKRNPLSPDLVRIQDLGSVRAKRKRHRTPRSTPALKPLSRSHKKSAAGRSERGTPRPLARLVRKRKVLSAEQKPVAVSQKSPEKGLNAHQTQSAVSSDLGDKRVRMRTPMHILMRSSRSWKSVGPPGQQSVTAEQKPAAVSQESPEKGLKAHQTQSAVSSDLGDKRVRMRTPMHILMRSSRSWKSVESPGQQNVTTEFVDSAFLKSESKEGQTPDSPGPSQTSTPTPKVPESTKTDQRVRDSPARNSPQGSAAQTPATESRDLARNPWKTKSFSKGYGKFSKRTYCSDSCVSRSATRECDRQSLLEQTPASCISVIAEPTEVSPQSARNITQSDQTASPTIDSKAKNVATPLFWSHNLRRGPDGRKVIVHYCRSLESTEEVAQHFLNSKVIGFDMEWKAQASASDSIQNNLSLVQIANEERIALFQIALFKPARNPQDFVSQSLKRILESPEITKVGVAIKADSTRLRRYLGIEARSIFELSHLYKLVKHGLSNPKLVNKRGVNLSEQVEEHFGLPLEKSDDVRRGDWTRALNYRQVQYAATDPYACLCLFNVMDEKRQAMDPVPPRPAHAELNMPIVLPLGETVNNEDNDPLVSDPVNVDVTARS